jgi:hypothetical protein
MKKKSLMTISFFMLFFVCMQFLSAKIKVIQCEGDKSTCYATQLPGGETLVIVGKRKTLIR